MDLEGDDDGVGGQAKGAGPEEEQKDEDGQAVEGQGSQRRNCIIF